MSDSLVIKRQKVKGRILGDEEREEAVGCVREEGSDSESDVI